MNTAAKKSKSSKRWPPRPKRFRVGQEVRLADDGLPMRLLGVLPDGSVRVVWVCHGRQWYGRFESWRLHS